LNEEDEKKRAEGCKRGKKKSEYTQKQRSHEKKFFATMTECGGRTLAGLSPLVKTDCSTKGIDDRQFYNTVGGLKTPEKQIMQCSTLVCSCFLPNGQRHTGPQKNVESHANTVHSDR